MQKATRFSKKRQAILDVIRDTDCHPSAEWVYQALKTPHPDLSLGTVYRNLIFFQNQGVLKSVGVVNGQERFDAITTPHSHFVCRRCGAVIDLSSLHMDASLNQAVSSQYGFAVENHELTFFGTCKQCIRHNKNEEETIS